MLGEDLQLKTTTLFVFFLWLAKIIDNRIVDHLEKCGFFSDFQYDFISSGSTADLLTVVCDRNARAFNSPFVMVFFTNLRLMEFQVRYLALFLSFLVIDGFELFQMESLHKNIQLMLEFLKTLFLACPIPTIHQ